MTLREVRIERDVPVEMRDGCHLYTDVYLPKGGQPAPGLLMRLPYAKELAETNVYAHPSWFAARGYVVAVQDVRGRGASEGNFEPFLHEGNDGYDSVEWLASRKECSGKVAMYGFSYVGATQLRAAAQRPPHLACIIPAHTSSDYFENWTYRGGALQWAFIAYWSYFLSIDTAVRSGDLAKAESLASGLFSVGQHFGTLPTRDFAAFPQELAPYFQEWLQHSSFDSYWQDRGALPSEIEWSAPAMHVAGWYDIFCDSAFDTYHAMQEQGLAQRLVIGPWWHMPWSPHMGIRDFGPSAVSHASDWVLEWADLWCRSETPEVESGRIDYFMMGTNEWQTAYEWPPKGFTEKQFFLASDGLANSSNGNGVLLDGPLEDSEPDRYVHNPLDPVPSCGGRSCCFSAISPMGPADQREIETRNDVLVFSSEALSSDLVIAGPVELVLYASSTAEDTDFTAKLVDVDSSGGAINLCDGIIRARYRDGGTESFLDEDTIYEFSIFLGNVAHTFKTGHRIRVEVASSNFPAFDRTPGSRMPVHQASWADMKIATQTIFHDSLYPSHLKVHSLA